VEKRKLGRTELRIALCRQGMVVVEAITCRGDAVQHNVLVRPSRQVNGHRLRPWSGHALGSHEVETVVEPVAAEGVPDLVHEWGLQSFPASDPPANW
jgi:hypothetical protein